MRGSRAISVARILQDLHPQKQPSPKCPDRHAVSQTWVYRPKYGQALTAHGARAGRLGAGAGRHEDSERTGVVCDSVGMDGVV
jgi:hypothetical protein